MAFYKQVFGADAAPSQYRDDVSKKAAEYKRTQQGAEKMVGGGGGGVQEEGECEVFFFFLFVCLFIFLFPWVERFLCWVGWLIYSFLSFSFFSHQRSKDKDLLDVISEPREMFEDLVSCLFSSELNDLKDLSPLRVATMCSVGKSFLTFFVFLLFCLFF